MSLSLVRPVSESYSDAFYDYTLSSSSPNVPNGGTILLRLVVQHIETGFYMTASDVQGHVKFDTLDLTVVSVSNDPILENTIDVEATVDTSSTFVDVKLVIV
jgi:hypothetical protein